MAKQLATGIGYNGKTFLLINDAGSPIYLDDCVITFRSEKGKLVSVRPPHKPDSSGHITIKFKDYTQEVYPGVCGFKFKEYYDKPTFKDVLLDFIAMSENEIKRIKTGKAPGPAMRDCIGQWESTIRDAKRLLDD